MLADSPVHILFCYAQHAGMMRNQKGTIPYVEIANPMSYFLQLRKWLNGFSGFA